MAWARIDDQMAFHAKIVKAGNEAVGAWVRMIAHSCAQLTDGFIDGDLATAFCGAKVLGRLVACELLDRVEEGFRIHDFHDWNPPADEIRAKREADKKRKAAGRTAQGRSSDGRVTSTKSSAGIGADVLPESKQSPRGQPADIRSESEIRPPVPSPVSRLPSQISHTPAEATDAEPEKPIDPILAALCVGADLYPSAGDLLGPTAKRIRVAVEGEPTAKRAGLTPAIAVAEAVVATRTWAAKHPQSSDGERLANVESVVVRWILGDCRSGKRQRPQPPPEREPWRRDSASGGRTDAISADDVAADIAESARQIAAQEAAAKKAAAENDRYHVERAKKKAEDADREVEKKAQAAGKREQSAPAVVDFAAAAKNLGKNRGAA